MKMVLNWVAVRPHGLIFDEDEATGCSMPPEALPTPFKVVLNSFFPQTVFTLRGSHAFSRAEGTLPRVPPSLSPAIFDAPAR